MLNTWVSRIYTYILATAIFVIAFTSTALASAALSNDDAATLLRPVWEAFAHGKYYYAGVLALVAIVGFVRMYGGVYLPWVRTDQGGAATALLAAFFATFGSTVADGGTPTWATVWNAGVIAVTAAGGYSLIKRLVITPYLVPLAEKNPKLQPLLNVILWLFNSPKK